MFRRPSTISQIVTTVDDTGPCGNETYLATLGKILTETNEDPKPANRHERRAANKKNV